MPFDEEDEEKKVSSPKVGLKLNNKNSILGEVAKKPSKEEFVKKAAEVNEQLNVYQQRAADLAIKFKKVLEDKTLPVNKNIFSMDAERDLLSDLVKLGIDMNLDENEVEGMGSMGLIMLLFRSLLIQRDKINNLEYTLLGLENKIKALDNKKT